MEQETLGSFLVHRAWVLGEMPATLTNRIGAGWSVWTRDLDRSINAETAQRVGDWAKLPVSQVHGMTVCSMLIASGQSVKSNGFQPWITPIGIYHRRRLRFGQLYCPACLASGVNHIPLSWRLASSLVCPLHVVRLEDCCPVCEMPFAPYRRDALMTGRCDHCSASLVRQMPQVASALEQRVQACLSDLWRGSVQGNAQRLDASHELLTRSATRDARFNRAGEPWAFWRVRERRAMLVTVISEYLGTNPVRVFVAGSRLANRRRCRTKSKRGTCLPKDREQRAVELLARANRLPRPRKPMARVSRARLGQR